jgi:hypothetical protein
LVPNLVALILFCTFILPWIGTGPLWNQVVRHHSDICKNTWWRNLLFIHNYFGFETMVSLTVIRSYELIPKWCDSGILHYPFLGFWILSIIWYFEQSIVFGALDPFATWRWKKVQFLNCCILFEIQWTLSRNPKVTNIHKNLSTILAILNFVCVRMHARVQLKAIRNLKVIAVSVYLQLTAIRDLH